MIAIARTATLSDAYARLAELRAATPGVRLSVTKDGAVPARPFAIVRGAR